MLSNLVAISWIDDRNKKGHFFLLSRKKFFAVQKITGTDYFRW